MRESPRNVSFDPFDPASDDPVRAWKPRSGVWDWAASPSPTRARRDALLASIDASVPPSPTSARVRVGWGVPGPHAAFALDADEALSLGPSSLGVPRGRPASAWSGSSLGGMVTPFPEPGDRVSGFRILTELGRGAFARVYLAEQADLADRRVALKVSQTLGDEPRMLARLQHTHIVPVHSVHTDPTTGLRLLCMPYLGGATLAKVLETASVRLPSQASGRSLVEALDQLGADPEADAALAPHAGSFAASQCPPASSWARGHDASNLRRFDNDGPTRDATAARWEAVALATGVPATWSSLWSRLSGGGRREASPPPAETDDVDLGRPARRFLRTASFVQAAVWIVARLAEALEHAHSRGLFHRDLKPSNILIAADGTPMLLDFNLAAEAAGPNVESGVRAMLGGTLPYMAPEHLDAFNPQGATAASAVDARSDLYALGLILYEMLAGHHPFPEPPPGLSFDQVLALMTAQRGAGAPSLRAVAPQVPWSLDAILRKCLDPDPVRRYARARDLAEDLRRFLDDRPLKFAAEPSLREQAAKWTRRHPRTSSATTLALLALPLILTMTTVAWWKADHLKTASARLARDEFVQAFQECQFLLNTSSGPIDHLDLGLRRARSALQPYQLDAGSSRPVRRAPAYLLDRLAPDEQDALRHAAAELMLLEARAWVVLAERQGSEARRRQALAAAVARLDHAERITPRPLSALFVDRASYLNALGQADRAAEDRARAARTPLTTARDYYLLGTSLLSQRNPQAAEPLLRQALDREPRSFWAWFVLGICHYDQGRWLDAAGDFQTCTALMPRFAWPYMNRGLALARAGRLTDALDAYNRALEADPHYVEALVNRSLTLLELGRPAPAERDLRRALALGRDNRQVRAALAEAIARLGRHPEAKRLYDQLIDRHPHDLSLRLARGYFRLTIDPQTARDDFDHVLARQPDHPRAHLGLALLLRQNEPETALEHADRALRSAPDDLDARELRALLRARRGDRNALDDLNYLHRAPTPRRLYNTACALAVLSETTNDPQFAHDALEYLQRALAAGFTEAHPDDPDLQPLRDHPAFARHLSAQKQ